MLDLVGTVIRCVNWATDHPYRLYNAQLSHTIPDSYYKKYIRDYYASAHRYKGRGIQPPMRWNDVRSIQMNVRPIIKTDQVTRNDLRNRLMNGSI